MAATLAHKQASARIPASAPASDTVLVRSRNRVFPERWQDESSSSALHALSASSDQRSLTTRLEESLWPRLPWDKKSDDVPALERTPRLVNTYTECLLAIRRWQEDLVAFCRSVCQTNLEFRQVQGTTQMEPAEQAMSQTLATMMEQSGAARFHGQNLLTAQLLQAPAAEVQRALENGLRQEVGAFAQHLAATLGRMVSAESVGLIEWTAPNVCCYHFFKEVVLQSHAGAQELPGDRLRRRADTSPAGWVETVIDRQTGHHEFRHARHEHHVLNAFHTSIRDTKVVMPPAVQRLVGSVPDWLYEFVRIIDGDIFRQRVIEGVRRRQGWVHDQPRDVPVFGCEPAVVIDEFVLTGWGPEVVAAELARRQALQQAAIPARTHYEWRLWKAGAVLGAVGSFVLEAYSHPLSSSILIVGAYFAAIQAVRSYALAQGRRANPLEYFGGLVCTFGLYTACGLVASGSFLKVLAGVAVAGITFVALAKLRHPWPKPMAENHGVSVEGGKA